MKIQRTYCLLFTFMAAVSLSACKSRSFESIMHPTDAGQLGRARSVVLAEQVRPIDQPLREATLAILTLVDGLPEHAEIPMQRVYETLRTRGLNANKQAAAAVINEDKKTWKGEPYEQALLYLYVAMQQGMSGEWGNARAASVAALELLDEYDRYQEVSRNLPPTTHGHVVSQSDLALAHLIASIANRAIGRHDEADDHLERVEQIRPHLQPVTDQLQQGAFDTVLIVEMGAGPVVRRAGEDGAIEDLVTRWPSDDRLLVVSDNDGVVRSVPRALDVNAFANLYQWHGLAGLRRGKSNVGSMMTVGGAALLTADDDEARWVGLGLLLGGLLAKAGAHADDRSLTVLPQRYFVVPLQSSALSGPLELRLGTGGRGASFVVPALASTAETPRLIVVRVPTQEPVTSGLTGEVLYSNDASQQRSPGDDLPYILGGTCVMAPTHEALRKYQSAGNLLDLTTADLRELYRQEGIVLPEDERPGVPPGAHVLEGGRSLAAPVAGSLGFVRLFCSRHPPYRPRSEVVARLAHEIGSLRTRTTMEIEQ